MSQFYAGIDSSTQSTKLLVIDLDTSKVVYTDSVQYDRDLESYHTRNGVMQGLGEGISESDPHMWIEALQRLFERLSASDCPQDRIRAVSVSGQQHGLVTLDDAGHLTRSRSKLWNDFSTQKECELLTEAVGGMDRMIEEVGNSQRTGYTAAKIYHLVRHDPDAYTRTSTCFLVHNYINWWLTGGPDGGVRVMEPGDTSGKAVWNPKTGDWSQAVLDAIASDLMKKLPPVQPSDQSIGVIGAGLVQTYGFSPTCKIDAGSGDNMYGAVGTGNLEPGIVTVSLGTSGTAYTYMEHPFIDTEGEIAAFCDSTGHHLPLLCVSNLANGYNAILEQFDLSHDAFVEVVRRVPVGNDGRLLLPWYMGERTPDLADATPVYFGFDLNDFTRDRLCRAVLEGHVLNLYTGFQRMPVQPREIRLTGGLARSDAWVQTIADVFNADAVPVEGEGAALGAACHAAWVDLKESGESVSLKSVVEPFLMMREEGRRQPDAEHVATYQTLKAIFASISKRIRGEMTDRDPFSLRTRL